jgi:hypothetical protein
LSGSSGKLDLRRTSTGVTLPVRLTPRSGRDEIVGTEAFGGETVLKARVRALPEDGRANQALERLIARWLKQILIEGDAETLARLIESRLAALAG